MLDAQMATEWVVYSKPCLAKTETVVDDPGRYSHPIALSDSRLLAVDGESVDPAYKDYRDGDRRKVMTLAGEEPIRRLLLHVLPKGLTRVRHYVDFEPGSGPRKLQLDGNPDVAGDQTKVFKPAALAGFLAPEE